MVKAFIHGAMGHWIDPLWWIHCAISRSTTGVTKAVVCLWDGAYKRTFAANQKE